MRSPTRSLLTAGLLLFASAFADQETTTATHEKLDAFFGQLVAGGEWRTPNPDYDPGEDTAREYVLRYRWGPHRQHMNGTLLGYFPGPDGGREELIWSLYAFHNPVTGDVLVNQIGANGALASGRAELAADGKHVIEQILYGPDGSMLALRHEETFAADGGSYRSDVFERGSDGGWQKRRDWIWTRHAAEAAR